MDDLRAITLRTCTHASRTDSAFWAMGGRLNVTFCDSVLFPDNTRSTADLGDLTSRVIADGQLIP